MKKNITIIICVFLLILFIGTISSGEENMTLAPVEESVNKTSQESYDIEETISVTAEDREDGEEIAEKETKEVSEEIYDVENISPAPTSKPLIWNDNDEGREAELENSGTEEESGKTGTNWVKQILNTVTSLIVVCLLVYIVLKLFYAKGAGIVPQPRKNLVVVEQVQLQPQKTMILSLVKAGEKLILIGATEKEISNLREFELQDFPAIAKKYSKKKKEADFNEDLESALNEAAEEIEEPGFLAKFFEFFGLSGLASFFDGTKYSKKQKRRN